jgi:hypothetical protein
MTLWYVGTTIYTIVVNFTILYKTINSKNLTKQPHSHEGCYSCLTQYLNLHITREGSRYSYTLRTNLNIRYVSALSQWSLHITKLRLHHNTTAYAGMRYSPWKQTTSLQYSRRTHVVMITVMRLSFDDVISVSSGSFRQIAPYFIAKSRP